jgi:membrane protein
VRDVIDGFRRHNLLTYASAIAFQVLVAIVPFLLFLLALVSVLGLDYLWTDHLGPDVRPHVSAAAYQVLNDTVNKVFASKRVFWVTAGALLTLWEISGGVRAVMGAMNGIYGAKRDDRSPRRRYLISLGLAAAVGLCFIGALAIVQLGAAAVPDGAVAQVLGFIVRWGLAALLFLLAVALLVRYAPATPQPVSWVSFGALVTVAGWVLFSLGFGIYLTQIASYGSIFGSFASLFVLMNYLYLSAVVFLAGLVVDAQVRKQASGSRSGR